jgi:hypothetical protein
MRHFIRCGKRRPAPASEHAMSRQWRSILFWTAVILLGVALQWWLVPNWTAESAPLAWWTWTPAPKPPGAWYDERQAALLVYAVATPLIPALVFGALMVGRRDAATRTLLRVALVLGAILVIGGIAFLLARQPRYLWGRFLFCGLLALWLAWAHLRHADRAAREAPT